MKHLIKFTRLMAVGTFAIVFAFMPYGFTALEEINWKSLDFSAVSIEKQSVVAATVETPLTAATGTLPDGTTWTVTLAGGASVLYDAAGNFDINGGGDNVVTIDFNAPVNVRLTPTDTGHGDIFQAPAGFDPSEVTTDGDDWIFTPGSVGSTGIFAVGDTVTGTADITSAQDWGSLI